MNVMKMLLDLQLFADAGTLVNAGGNYVNAYTGETTAFPATTSTQVLARPPHFPARIPCPPS